MCLQLALEAFIEAIKVFPLDLASVCEDLGASSASAVFEASPPLQQLGKLLDRVTYLGACDLLLEPDAISARNWYSITTRAGADDVQRKALVGALLERQIASLEGSRWKKGVDRTVQQLLRHALVLYEAAVFPIRRARIFLQLLEGTYYAMDERGGGKILGMSAEDLAAQVRALLNCQVSLVSRLLLIRVDPSAGPGLRHCIDYDSDWLARYAAPMACFARSSLYGHRRRVNHDS